MLNKEQLKEIKNHLENSQNPLFFFDNDVDGLCAFLILRRAINRGKGIPIKTYPELKTKYLRKIEELNPDSIFILDKAEVEEDFIEEVKKKNLPIIWIDHHKTKTKEEFVNQTNYYNSLPSAEPTSYMAQKVFSKKEDLWLAMIGCIGEVYIPDFAEEFEKNYPELFSSKISAFEALHTTQIGKMVRMLNFGQMDTTTNVINLIKYLFKAKNAYDLLEENKDTKQLHKRYKELNDYYQKQINKAELNIKKDSKILFFTYSGEISMSSEIANRLLFNYPDKIIIVAFLKPDKVNISIRGKNALKFTEEIIKNIPEATGGGHVEATGMMVPLDKLERFKTSLKKLETDNSIN